MNDAEFRKQKARVDALIARWVKPIGLGWWRLTFRWYREDLPLHAGQEPPAPGNTVAMDCNADWRYNHATIRICLPQVAEMDDDHLEWVFVHELMHVYLNEVREAGLEHEERAASHLASAFLWIRAHHAPKAVKRPKKPAALLIEATKVAKVDE